MPALQASRLEEAMSGFVYFAQLENKVKIGRSFNPPVRTRGLKAKLIGILPGGEKESSLHRKFKEFSVGGEWFRFSTSIKEYIEESGASKNLKVINFFPNDNLIKVLLKLPDETFEKVEALAKAERRKPGPMAAVIVERFVNGKA